MAWTGTKWKAVLLDFLERAGWSAGQVFFATILAGGGTAAVVGLPWKYASVLALSAALSSIVLTIVQYLARFTNLPFWPDLLVRLAKTFVGSIAASVTASSAFDITTFHWSSALNVAAIATIGALGKGLLARGAAGAPQVVGAAPPGAVGAVPAGPDGGPPAGAAAIPGSRLPADATRPSPSTLPDVTYLDAIRR
jgi:hypothetical protein